MLLETVFESVLRVVYDLFSEIEKVLPDVTIVPSVQWAVACRVPDV